MSKDWTFAAGMTALGIMVLTLVLFGAFVLGAGRRISSLQTATDAAQATASSALSNVAEARLQVDKHKQEFDLFRKSAEARDKEHDAQLQSLRAEVADLQPRVTPVFPKHR